MTELLIAMLVAWLLVSSTDTGRRASAAFYRSAGGPSRKQVKAKGRRLATAGGASAGRASRRTGAAAGRGLRRGGTALGRAGRSAGVKVGDRARGRLDRRDTPTPLIWRDQPARADKPAGPGADATPPDASSQPSDATTPTAPEQQPTPPKETPVNVTELEAPQSDGQFLADLHAHAQAALAVSQALEEYSSTLTAMRMSRTVTGHIHAAGEAGAEMASQITAAARQFEDEYAEARDLAAGGMHFRGEDAA